MWWLRRVRTILTIWYSAFKWRPKFVSSKFGSIHNSNRCLLGVFIVILNNPLSGLRVQTPVVVSVDTWRDRSPDYNILLWISWRKTTPVSCRLKYMIGSIVKCKCLLSYFCVRLRSTLMDTQRYWATLSDTQRYFDFEVAWHQYHISMHSWST